MSRRGISRTTNSSTTVEKDRDAGGSNSEGEVKTDDGLAGAILSEDVMLIDKIYADLRLRSLDDPNMVLIPVRWQEGHRDWLPSSRRSWLQKNDTLCREMAPRRCDHHHPSLYFPWSQPSRPHSRCTVHIDCTV